MSHQIVAANALTGAEYQPSGPLTLEVRNGQISALTEDPVAQPAGSGTLVMPALTNAHDHARPLSSTSFGAAGKPLETWLPRLAAVPSVDPYLAAVAPLGRAALGGCAGVMVQYTRAQGFTGLDAEAAEVARAAADVGVRVGFAVALKDRNPLVYGDHHAVLDSLPAATRRTVEQYFSSSEESVAAQMERVDAVVEAAGRPGFDVQYGPTGVQWCSRELLAAVAEASARTGRRVHMHLLETRYQRDYADRQFPGGIVRYLDELGLLSPRLTLAHCTYARPDELELIAASGALISVNTSSNLHLRSGIAPVGEMLRRGCRIGLGMDGAALDEDDDGLREMRLAHLLHGGWGFEKVMGVSEALNAAMATGRAAVGAPSGGTLDAGASADLLLLDMDALDRDALMPVDPRELIFARANRAHIRKLLVDGHTVVDNSRLTGVDLAAVHTELRDQMRAGLKHHQGLLDAWPHLEPALERFYSEYGCC